MQPGNPYHLIEAVGSCQVGSVWSAIDPQGRSLMVALLDPNVATDQRWREAFQEAANALVQAGEPGYLYADFASGSPWVAYSAENGIGAERVFLALGMDFQPVPPDGLGPLDYTPLEPTTQLTPAAQAPPAPPEQPTAPVQHQPLPPAIMEPVEAPPTTAFGPVQPIPQAVQAQPIVAQQSPAPVTPRSAPPVTPQSAPPVTPQSAPPVTPQSAPPVAPQSAPPVAPQSAPPVPPPTPAPQSPPPVPPPAPAPQSAPPAPAGESTDDLSTTQPTERMDPAPAMPAAPINPWAPQPIDYSQQHPTSAPPHPISGVPTSVPPLPTSVPPHQTSGPPHPTSVPPHQTSGAPTPISGTPMSPAYGQPLSPAYGAPAPAYGPRPPQGPAPYDPYAPVTAPPPRRPRTGLWIGLAVAVLVLIAGGGGVYAWSASGGEPTPPEASASSNGTLPPPEVPTAPPVSPGIEPPTPSKWPANWPRFNERDNIKTLSNLDGLGFTLKVPQDWECTLAGRAQGFAKYTCGARQGQPDEIGGELIVRDCQQPCDAARQSTMRQAEEAWGVQWIRTGQYTTIGEQILDVEGQQRHGLVVVAYWRSGSEGVVNQQLVFRMTSPVKEAQQLRRIATYLRDTLVF